MSDAKAVIRQRRWSWLLWWQIVPADLDLQVEEYETLGFFKSMRGISVCCLVFSMALTAALIAWGVADFWAIADIAIFVVLAAFIYFGHRWAMVGAMILWTVEKLTSIADGLEGAQPGTLVGQVIWWCIFMHAFYFAFRVEQERRKRAGLAKAF
jgi:hypothetical protein